MEFHLGGGWGGGWLGGMEASVVLRAQERSIAVLGLLVLGADGGVPYT